MQRTSICFVAFVLFISMAAAAQDEVFTRRPGLWEMTISAHGQRQVMKQCSDETTDALLQKSAAGMNQSCTKQVNRREGANYVAEAECAMMGSTVKSRAVFSGDFSSSYTGDITAAYSPPLMGQKESKTKITARHLGPCGPGQKPGDVLLPGGLQMNISDLEKMQVPKQQAGAR